MAKLVIIDIIVAEIEAAGFQPQVERGGKHYKASFEARGRRFTCTVPCTASDRRAALNCRATIRRLIRQALEETDLPSGQE